MHAITRRNNLNVILLVLFKFLTDIDAAFYGHRNSIPASRFQLFEVQQKYYSLRTALPLSVRQAEQEGWNKVATHKEYNFDIYRFQEANNFFVFYYNNGVVGVGPTYKYKTLSRRVNTPNQKRKINKAFLMVSILNEMYTNIQGNDDRSVDSQSVFKHTVVIDDSFYKYAVILFLHPVALLKRKGIKHRTLPYIYFEGGSKLWHQVPMIESEINTATMLRQGCLNKYGYFYFYNLNNDTPCKDVHGFFSFYDNRGHMAGFGVFYTKRDLLWEDMNHPHPLYRFWETYEVKDIVPNNKNCITSRISRGFAAINVFIQPQHVTDNLLCVNKVDDVLLH